MMMKESVGEHSSLVQIYGMKAKKLRYEDLVASVAFKHCNGIVQIPAPKYKKGTEVIEMVRVVRPLSLAVS